MNGAVALPALSTTAHLLVALATVVAVAELGAIAARLVRQPTVLGQIAAGIALGPSLLSRFAPDVAGWLLPPEAVGSLRALGQIGLVLFMFLVGHEMDTAALAGAGRRAIVISQVSILVPFGLGAAVGPWMHHTLGLEGRVLPFSLFVGVAMAITAFPVLARILQEVGLAGTPLGSLALTCAAVDDVTAWCALAVIAGVSGASGSTGWSGAAGMLAATVGFAGVMFLVVRPLTRRMRPSLVATVVIAVAAAAVTEWIGLHSIFGGFLAGVALGGRPEPLDPEHLAPEHREGVASVEPVVTNVLLPAFFVVVGSSVAISELDRPERWLVLAVVLLVAVVGKLGGTAAAALALGEERRAAWTLGVLLNTRGLTEIVMLSVGLDLGIIDETVFTIMVVMALVTTFAAGPLLRRRSASSGSGRSGFGPVRVP